MAKILFVDDEKCTGCRLCEMYCSLTKSKTCNPARSRIRVIKREEQAISVPVLCQHCHDAPCMMVCPVNAITRDESTLMVALDNDVCIGCHTCLVACPFGALSIDPVEGSVIKCDQCGGDPICAKVCSTGAIEYMEADRFGLMRRRQGLEKLASLKLTDVVGGENQDA